MYTFYYLWTKKKRKNQLHCEMYKFLSVCNRKFARLTIRTRRLGKKVMSSLKTSRANKMRIYLYVYFTNVNLTTKWTMKCVNKLCVVIWKVQHVQKCLWVKGKPSLDMYFSWVVTTISMYTNCWNLYAYIWRT